MESVNAWRLNEKVDVGPTAVHFTSCRSLCISASSPKCDGASSTLDRGDPANQPIGRPTDGDECVNTEQHLDHRETSRLT